MFTRAKIAETKFFWGKFSGAGSGTAEWHYYFSAFVAAFRSITFTMQSDFKRKNGFDEVYEIIRSHLKHSPIAQEILLARNITIKQGPRVPVTVAYIHDEATGNRVRAELDVTAGSWRPFTTFVMSNDMRGVASYPKDANREEVLSALDEGMRDFLLSLYSVASTGFTFYIQIVPGGIEHSWPDLRSEVDMLMEYLEAETQRLESSPLSNA